MKILHVDEQLGWRGGEIQASWLMQGLVELGHEVALAGRPGGQFVGDDHGGIPVQRFELPMRYEADFMSMRSLAKIVRAHNVDIVHAHSSHGHIFAAMATRFAGTGKSVISKRLDRKPRRSFINRWKYDSANHYVPVSNRVAGVLRDYGIPDDKITLVYDCIRPDLLNVEPLDRADLGVADDATLLLSAGALVDQKDFSNLIQSMPYFIDAYPKVRVLIAGEGELRSKLEREISDRGYDEIVSLLGQRTDVARLMRTADLYVSSSHTEGLGTSILESLACKLPIVASDAGGVCEMVIDEQTGYLVPNRNPRALGEAIAKALGDPQRTQQMADNGLVHIEENFLPHHMVKGFVAVYEKLLAAES
jgi:glycosyltransferase involved in cell wall biosynthesis